MHILLIGGTGNLSSETAASLYRRGHTITTVTTGNKPVPPLYTSIIANRNDIPVFREKLANVKADVVIDFFAFTPEHVKLDYELFNGRIGHYIFISSATVYEKPHRKFPITEKTARANQFWPYAQQKIACEEFCESVHSDAFPVTIVRPSHTFGREWIPSPINSHDFTVAKRILDGRPIILHDKGESLWTLTAASDFAEGVAGLVGNPAATGEAFHITSDDSQSWNEIYATIGLALGSAPIIEYLPSEFIAKEYREAYGMLFGDKKEHGVFDNQKIKRFVPGFECRKSFEEAIKESVAWFKADPARQVVDKEDDALIDRLISAWKSNRSTL